MARQFENDHRTGPRYLANLEIKAEWEEAGGDHVVAQGTTENVGPDGTLVHFPHGLPSVGSRVLLEVQGDGDVKLQLTAEVLRIERNPGHPLAALQLLGETDEWRGLVWEPAAPRVTPPPPVESENDADGEADEDEEVTQ